MERPRRKGRAEVRKGETHNKKECCMRRGEESIAERKIFDRIWLRRSNYIHKMKDEMYVVHNIMYISLYSPIQLTSDDKSEPTAGESRAEKKRRDQFQQKVYRIKTESTMFDENQYILLCESAVPPAHRCEGKTRIGC